MTSEPSHTLCSCKAFLISLHPYSVFRDRHARSKSLHHFLPLSKKQTNKQAINFIIIMFLIANLKNQIYQLCCFKLCLARSIWIHQLQRRCCSHDYRSIAKKKLNAVSAVYSHYLFVFKNCRVIPRGGVQPTSLYGVGCSVLKIMASPAANKALVEGPLSKWTNVVSGWQYRWFVLDQSTGLLSYYTVSNRSIGRFHLRFSSH